MTQSTRRTLLGGLLLVLLVLLFVWVRSAAVYPMSPDFRSRSPTQAVSQAQPTPPSPGVFSVPSSAEVVFSGRSPIPTGGALVAPLELAWRLVKEPGDSVAFSGTITVRNLGRSGELQITVQPRGDARLSSSGSRRIPEFASGAEIELPVAGTLGHAGKRGALYVDATITTFGLQLPRDLTIEFDSRPSGDSGPPTGSRIIIDDHGQRVILQPAVP